MFCGLTPKQTRGLENTFLTLLMTLPVDVCI